MLVACLADAGHEVTILSRRRMRPVIAGASQIVGDREDTCAVEQAFASGPYDWVIDNIAYTSEAVADVARLGTGRIRRYMLVSTAWVYLVLGDRGAGMLSESALPPGSVERERADWALGEHDVRDVTREYVAGKWAAEAETMRMPWSVTILRPSMLAGECDQNARIAFYVRRVLDGGPVLMIGGGRDQFQLLWAGDMVRAMMSLIQSERDDTSVFNVAPPETLSASKIVDLVEEQLGQRVERVESGTDWLESAYPEYLEYEPFAHPVPGSYSSARLLEEAPDFRFTAAAMWVKETAHWAVERDDACLEVTRRAREREAALARANRGGG